jgi:hypothetical protein
MAANMAALQIKFGFGPGSPVFFLSSLKGENCPPRSKKRSSSMVVAVLYVRRIPAVTDRRYNYRAENDTT